MTSSDTGSMQRPNRRQIWLLIGLFFAPLAAAFILYYGVEGWRPAGSTNHGDLVTPPRTLAKIAVPTPGGRSVSEDFLHGKWTLIYVGDGQCDTRCRDALYLIRQTRLSLNDDMSRVQRVFVATGHCCDEPWLSTEHAGLVTVLGDSPAGARLLQEFPQYDGTAVATAGRIYVADPLGNLMMTYSPSAQPKGLLEDLKKLLKLSHIG
jgi:cytochrome oxidase Cu insertion factor (SCO1/SenC/PrrC family)